MYGEKEQKFDLEERTAKFGEDIIKFSEKIPKTPITSPLIGQLVRSATSIGANYCEADCAETKKDFEHKLGICNKESKETRHWLRMIATAAPILKEEANIFWQETNELNLIFSAIIRKSRINRGV
jgi:four helix bundle protein